MKRFYIKIILLFGVVFPLRLSQATSFQTFDSVWEVMQREFKLNHQLYRPEVQRQIRWLIAHPDYLQSFAQAKPYLYHIVMEIKKRNLPGELALVPMVESSYDPFVYSGKGAAGLWQIMPATGKELGLKKDWWADGRRGITPSTQAALNYLQYLQHFFQGNWDLAFAAYNAGEGKIGHAIKASHQSIDKANFWSLSLPQETKAYVPRLLALAEIISHADKYHVNLPFIPHTPYFQEVQVHQQLDLNHVAELAGMTYKEFIKLNPEFNHWATTPQKSIKLLIPKSHVEDFHQKLALLKQDKPLRLTHHTVRQGETLQQIARQYFTSADKIKQLNQLETHPLKKGQVLIVPVQKMLALNTTHHTPSKHKKSHAQLPKYLKTIHIVQKNESIQHIAHKYHTTPYTIYQWNRLKTSLPIHTGQQLVIWKPSDSLLSKSRA